MGDFSVLVFSQVFYEEARVTVTVRSVLCFSEREWATFSSVPSLQSKSWSHIQSANTHSPLLGHFTSPDGHGRGQVEQPSSSEWSRQSRFPSQRREEDIHWPFSHLNSDALHFS